MFAGVSRKPAAVSDDNKTCDALKRNRKWLCAIRLNGTWASIHEIEQSVYTRCGWDGLRFETQWAARFSGPVQTGPGTHWTSCTMFTGSLSCAKSCWVLVFTIHLPRQRRGFAWLALYPNRRYVSLVAYRSHLSLYSDTSANEWPC